METTLARPELQIDWDGRPLSAREVATLGEIRVRQRLSLPTLLELAFFDLPQEAGEGYLPGAAVRVAAAGREPELFQGESTAIEHTFDASGGRTLRLRAYDLLHRLKSRYPSRIHVHSSAADLAREMAGSIGLSVEAHESGPAWPRLLQAGVSDFDLLADIADRGGLHFTTRGRTLHLFSSEGTGEAAPLILGDTLLEACAEVNTGSGFGTVSTRGWSPLAAELRAGRAGGARSGRDAEGAPEQGERSLMGVAVPDDTHAEALAQAELDDRTARRVVLRGVAAGDPALRPGVRVDVRRLGPGFEGRYVVTETTHRVDARHGYVTEFTTEPAVRRSRPLPAVAALGLVTSVDDPDGLGRVQVSLPAYGELETGWMQVLMSGAGPSKGIVALPDVGDRVLLLLPQGDPSQGVVLGGLYGPKSPPDAGVEGGAIKRYSFITPGGQKLRLDDGGRSIVLETSDGSRLELTPDRVLLHAATDLEIEAPGKSVVIRGNTVDFKRG